MDNVIVSWGVNIRRSKSISSATGFYDFHIKPHFKSNNKIIKLLGYFFSSVHLILFLFKCRPVNIIIVAPPVIPIYIGYLYYKISRNVNFYIDMHNGGLRNEWKYFPFLRRIYGQSTFICHNEVVKKRFDSFFNIESKVLLDPLFDKNEIFSRNSPVDYISDRKINVLVPLSYAEDEPLDLIFSIAEKLSEKFLFICTGNYRKKFKNEQPMLPGVYFTGFIKDEEYFSLLQYCDMTLCLTNNDDIQMCAVIESISAEKYFICTNNEVNRIYFSAYAYKLCDHKETELIQSLKNFHYDKNEYRLRALDFSSNNYMNIWVDNFRELCNAKKC